MATFHGRHPDVELSLREAEPDEAAASEAGDVDLALVYDHPATMLAPDLDLTHLLDDYYDALLPPATLSPAAADCRSPTSPTSPGSSPRTCGCRKIIASACRDAGSSRAWRSRPTRRCRPGAVAAGVGVTLLPAWR